MKHIAKVKRLQRWVPSIILVLSTPFIIFSRGCDSPLEWCNASYIQAVICAEAVRAAQPPAAPVSTCPPGCIAGQCLGTLYGPGNSCVKSSSTYGTCEYCSGYFLEVGGGQSTASTVNIVSIPTTLAVTEPFDVVFTTGIVPGSLVLDGPLGAAASELRIFSEQMVFNDTVRIAPRSTWPSGSAQTLTITAENDLGVTFTETVNIKVVAPAAQPAPPAPEPIPWWVICFFTKAC